MKKSGICREDLLEKLSEIYTQIEELEMVLHSSYLKQQTDIQKLQIEGLDIVERRLTHFEAEVDKLTNVKNFSKKPPIARKLELGMESM